MLMIAIERPYGPVVAIKVRANTGAHLSVASVFSLI